jgi:tetratricopeptide (TPR) repeat protein
MSTVRIKESLAKNRWRWALVLAIATFIAYQPVWRAGFIWDDDDHLTANPSMTAPDGLEMIWSSLSVSRYYPLTLTSFWIQRHMWSLNPLPYHLVNVVLHLFNGILIFLLLRRLRVPAPGLAAALWVLHPVNVESVAWITEMKNTQSGIFFFLALLCFLRFEEESRRRWYLLAVLCGMAALLSKPSTVVLPLAMLLCVWWERGRWRWVDLLHATPFFALALGMSAVTVIEQRGRVLGAGTPEWNLNIMERLTIAGKVVWFYAAKLIWPMPLSFIYSRWPVGTESFSSWIPLLGLIALSIFLWVQRHAFWARACIFGLGFFVAALLPVLGFFDVFFFRFSFVADHFQYLASVGLIALVVGAGAKICERIGPRGREIGAVTAVAALVTLGSLTWTRAHVYHDSETLWRDTLAKNPECWMAEMNLGTAILQMNRPQEAIPHFEQALRIKPNYAKARNNWGMAILQMNRPQEAIPHFEQALRIRPNLAEAENNLGLAILQMNRPLEAIPHFERALRIRPNLAEAHYNAGNAFLQMSKPQVAIPHFEQALRINPNYTEAENNLAWLLATLPQAEGGDPVRAVSWAEQACELTGNRSADNLDTLAVAYGAAGRFSDAIATSQKAIELAHSAGRAELVREMEARLELYRNGRAYRPPLNPLRGKSTNVTSSHNP